MQVTAVASLVAADRSEVVSPDLSASYPQHDAISYAVLAVDVEAASR
jgi:hypothetical protein